MTVLGPEPLVAGLPPALHHHVSLGAEELRHPHRGRCCGWHGPGTRQGPTWVTGGVHFFPGQKRIRFYLKIRPHADRVRPKEVKHTRSADRTGRSG